MRKTARWTTSDEIGYLTSLGEWHPGNGDDAGGRYKRLLRGYRRAMRNRVRWDAVDPEAISNYLATGIAPIKTKKRGGEFLRSK